MTNELHFPAPVRADLPTLLWQIAWPFCIFSMVLASLMALSWTLLLPRYTRIEVGGTLRSAEEIVRYRESLTADITTKERARRQHIVTVHAPEFETLTQLRQSRVSLDDLRDSLTKHATALTGKEDIVHWTALRYDPEGKSLVLQGDIRNVSTRSMTVLAEFAQSLKDLPFVASATTPSFTREEDPVIGMHSPFTVTLSLR